MLTKPVCSTSLARIFSVMIRTTTRLSPRPLILGLSARGAICCRVPQSNALNDLCTFPPRRKGFHSTAFLAVNGRNKCHIDSAETHYAVLGVTRSATQADIKQ